jgi:hypothetical protein
VAIYRDEAISGTKGRDKRGTEPSLLAAPNLLPFAGFWLNVLFDLVPKGRNIDC